LTYKCVVFLGVTVERATIEGVGKFPFQLDAGPPAQDGTLDSKYIFLYFYVGL
jgi:hypothetical protein